MKNNSEAVPEVFTFDASDPNLKRLMVVAKGLNREPKELFAETLSDGLRRKAIKEQTSLEFRAAIARWERQKGTSTKLLNLEILIRCHHSLGSHPDTLLRDESGKLYLVYCTRSLPDA